jgi:hypothetical protein
MRRFRNSTLPFPHFGAYQVQSEGPLSERVLWGCDHTELNRGRAGAAGALRDAARAGVTAIVGAGPVMPHRHRYRCLRLAEPLLALALSLSILDLHSSARGGSLCTRPQPLAIPCPSSP